ncbi:MAG: hypothetical protein IT443_03990 [Phycisphaeraceae bacterium]|nr:hypothetical protein [Phycisphaeraceae bacterium]
MARIEIGREIEEDRRWRYEVAVHEGAARHDVQITLSWSDYDLWSHGRVPPHRVVWTVVKFLLDRQPAGEMHKKFDCAAVRRLYPELDTVLPGLI